tara:strand:- start:44 stop:889 length:846 start_codon:yes stop_codon:yes gene_type:complete
MKNLSSISVTMAYCKSIIVDVIHKFLISRKRSTERVSIDYDKGEWTRNLDQMKFKKYDDLSTWNYSWNEGGSITATIDGKLVRIEASEYYKFRNKKLVSFIDEFFDNNTDLCELGCGSGRNLFAIKQLRPEINLAGYDISEAGIQTVKEIASHFNVDNLSVLNADLIAPDGLTFDIKDKNVFTYFVLEQLPNSLDIFFENVINAKPKKVLHLEPTFELLDRFSLRDFASRVYVQRQDYVSTIVSKLNALEAEGRIEIIATRRELYSSSLKQMPTLVCWKPT